MSTIQLSLHCRIAEFSDQASSNLQNKKAVALLWHKPCAEAYTDFTNSTEM